jgi:hypothetical protein
MCWASFGVSPSAAGQGATRRGSLGCSALWHDSARAAMAARRAFGPSLPPSLVDFAWRGVDWRGAARHGGACQCGARVTDGGTEGFGLPCHPHKGGQCRVGLGRFWPDVLRQGAIWLGAARAADSSTEPLRRFPAALFGGQIWHGVAGRGGAK